MAKVLGIGGVFFKAADAEATKAWYARVLGFDVTPHGVMFPPLPEGGITVWSPFPADTGYFAPSTAPLMLNLAVDDLDGVLARVRAEGVEVMGEQSESYGRFAWILDPDGMKLELWQAAAEAGDDAAQEPPPA